MARVRTPLQRKRELLEEFERSGLSGAKFAALAGVKYSTFAAWVSRQKRVGPARATAPAVEGGAKVRWLEAMVDRAHLCVGPRLALTIEFNGGAKVEIADGQQVGLAAALLRALAGGAAPC